MTKLIKRSLTTLITLPLIACTGTATKLEPEQIPDPLQHYYVIDVDRGLKEHDRSEGRVLYIAPVKVTSQFRAKNLVFRVGENAFQPQPDHQFFDTPQQMFTVQLQRWLKKTGLFKTVTTKQTVEADYTLETAVTGLYGDKMLEKPTKAILEMQFFLTDNNADKEEIVFQTGLHIDTHIMETTPSDTVKGWKTGLRKTLSTLEDDLSSYFLPDSP